MFHSARAGTDLGLRSTLGLQYVESFRENKLSRVWFPGSGTSLAPRVFAQLGFDVLSSDFSPVAVAVQESIAVAPLPAEVTAMLEGLDRHAPSKLATKKHDFRMPLDAVAPFDVVLNVRAFQGLSRDDMPLVAAGHCAALRAGGWAIFETMNVQGEARNQLETVLLNAGFFLPLYDTERWYRAKLKATGIDHVMILSLIHI